MASFLTVCQSGGLRAGRRADRLAGAHTGIIWPHGWPKVIFQSWNIIMILLTAIEKCCGYSKPLRLFHSYVWFICDSRSKLKKSGILSGGPFSTKKNMTSLSWALWADELSEKVELGSSRISMKWTPCTHHKNTIFDILKPKNWRIWRIKLDYTCKNNIFIYNQL